MSGKAQANEETVEEYLKNQFERELNKFNVYVEQSIEKFVRESHKARRELSDITTIGVK
jgi:hypothetical protein